MFRSIVPKSHTTATLDALGRSLAIIEFEPDGTIITANAIFCRMMGYDLSEIVTRHHRMFVERGDIPGSDTPHFWERGGAGAKPQDHRRIAKGGRTVWVRSSYAPVTDARGSVVKVIEIAFDVTAETHRRAELEDTLTALPGPRR